MVPSSSLASSLLAPTTGNSPGCASSLERQHAKGRHVSCGAQRGER